MAKVSLENVRIASQEIIPSPRELSESYPVSDAVAETVSATRVLVQRILERRDPRLLVVVGPCSIHDEDAALEYGHRLGALAEESRDSLLIVMRTYFEKPRTRIGWKGFLNDPHLDDSFRLDEGLARARALLLAIGELGLGVGSEALDPITPQYLGDLVSWVAIGARTTESQTHREMASGLSAPVGFKNGTDGNVEVAINALEAARHPHSFLGVTREGRCAVFRTTGNPHGHVILRGGTRPNYDSVSVALCEQALVDRRLPENIMVDCSHGNSRKRPRLRCGCSTTASARSGTAIARSSASCWRATSSPGARTCQPTFRRCGTASRSPTRASAGPPPPKRCGTPMRGSSTSCRSAPLSPRV